MKGNSKDIIKKIAAESYSNIEADFMTALNKIARALDIKEEDLITAVQKAKKDSLDIFRAKGKEIQCIIQGNSADTQLKSMERVGLFAIGTIITSFTIFTPETSSVSRSADIVSSSSINEFNWEIPIILLSAENLYNPSFGLPSS